MGLNTIFGINGIGKDTIAEELRKKNPQIRVTSVSRILMYILGITNTYDVREKVTEEQYKLLENTPQSTMIEIENNDYRKLLEKIAKNENKTIFINHLVTAMRHGKKIEYLTERKIPNWFIELNDNIIQIVSPSNLIAQRRMNDISRNRSTDINQIEEHQELCTKEWKRISEENILFKNKMHIVENIQLSKAVADIENIILEKDKHDKKLCNSKNKFEIEDYVAELLVRSGCYVNANKIGDKSIKTPNGDNVSAYLSCRLAISDVKTRDILEKGLTGKVKQQFKENITIAGMATAGITWAHAIAKNNKLPMIYIRSNEKDYGLKGFIEGNLENTFNKAVIVDDVLYTGNTVRKAQEILKENGIETVGVACIAVLRDKIVNELKSQNISVISLTHYRNLLESARRNNVLSDREYILMKNIYEEKGEER